MEFIDLKSQQKRIRDKIDENIKKVLDSGRYILGPEVEEIEKKLAKYVGVKHAISCASGTDALLLSLMALGVRPGDRIITTPFTFVATAEVIRLLGAYPVFVDIDPHTFNIDPEKIEELLKYGRASGIIVVNLFGLPADYGRIDKIASKHNLFVVEDAAQSFGASYRGRKSGSLGDISCTSFFPAKPLGCYGDGGMCFTRNDSLAREVKLLRTHGENPKYYHSKIGICSRLDTLQAAILKAKFEVFPEEIMCRQLVANTYNDFLSESSLLLQKQMRGTRSAWAQYSILSHSKEHRSRIQKRLSDNGIPSAIYYPLPLNQQEAFKDNCIGVNCPVSEEYSDRIFSIPMHPYLSREDQSKIINVIGGVKNVAKATDKTLRSKVSRR